MFLLIFFLLLSSISPKQPLSPSAEQAAPAPAPSVADRQQVQRLHDLPEGGDAVEGGVVQAEGGLAEEHQHGQVEGDVHEEGGHRRQVEDDRAEVEQGVMRRVVVTASTVVLNRCGHKGQRHRQEEAEEDEQQKVGEGHLKKERQDRTVQDRKEGKQRNCSISRSCSIFLLQRVNIHTTSTTQVLKEAKIEKKSTYLKRLRVKGNHPAVQVADPVGAAVLQKVPKDGRLTGVLLSEWW